MGDSFTKLFSSIIDSTVWAEDDTTRIVWVTMLAMADQHGYVGASVPGLAARARKTVRETVTALKKLMAPDPYSRTKDHEGRRIVEVERGWTLLNYRKFRDARDDEARREYERERKRDQRSKDVRDIVRDSPGQTGTDGDTAGQPGQVDDVPSGPVLSAQAEADPLSLPGSGSPPKPPDQSKAGAKWPASEWLKLFGARWIAKYGGLKYGGGDATARAIGQLRDIIADLPEPDAIAAQARAAEMLTEFFDDVAPKVLDARHPFTFFVTAFSGLRVPRLASRSLPEKVQQTREAGRRFLERHEGER